jgi:uncharacterized membrane protein YeaQ/YmgE (transglycosylase-associated protein family)
MFEPGSLITLLIVGLVAGWLAGKLIDGTGFGLIGDIVVGIIGAFIGSWLLAQLGIFIGMGIVGAIITAAIGAAVLLIVIKLIKKVI